MTIIRASQIAEFLNLELYGQDIEIRNPSSLNSIKEGSFVFANQYDKNTLNTLNSIPNILAIVTQEYHEKLKSNHLIADKPRLNYAKVLQQFYTKKLCHSIAPTAILGENVTLGHPVKIGEYVVIGDNVKIGNNTEIRNHVVIADNTIIGNYCLIKSNTVIGEDGFGFALDENNIPIRIPHLGNVQIGNHVEIGALNTIVRATLDTTIIGDYVKTDDHVHIAHNVIIGDKTMITACAEISGSVNIGQEVWLSPNISINNNLTIGDQAMIGMGAVVTKNIGQNDLAVGNPARIIKKRFE